MRHSSAVTPQDVDPALLEVDAAAPGYGTHLPFHLILRRCAVAWRDFLLATPGFDAGADGVIVPHVSADFVAEVRVGPVDIEVALMEIGTTSFTVRCTVIQDETVTARVGVVLVRFDYGRGAPVPLSQEQRNGLAAMLDEQQPGPVMPDGRS